MAGSAGGGKGEPVFQVAPMVDVLLVLLIFFMSITSAQVLKVDKSITLPLAATPSRKTTRAAKPSSMSAGMKPRERRPMSWTIKSCPTYPP